MKVHLRSIPLLSLLVFILSNANCQISVPVVINKNGLNARLIFTYDKNSSISLESAVYSFCETNYIFSSECEILLKECYRLLRNSSDGIEYSFEKIMHPEAREMEKIMDFRVHHLKSTVSSDINFRNHLGSVLFQDFVEIAGNSSTSRNGRVAFIHSCILERVYPIILQEILNLIYATKLIDELDKIWVINIGENINKYPELQTEFDRKVKF